MNQNSSRQSRLEHSQLRALIAKLTERVEALEAKQRAEAKPPAKPPVDAWGF
jgi:uncharacterized coiled-coil protein SlyX